MHEYMYNVLDNIASNTDSILIILLIVLIVGLAILAPFAIKWRRDGKAHDLERQNQLINVIKENSTVMAGLKTLLKGNVEVQRSGFTRIHERLDDQGKTLAAVNVKVDKIIVANTGKAAI